MIKIIVNSITLPLPFDTKITREFETTILNRELANYDFTYPFNIPLTDEVIKAFGFINELANKTTQQTFEGDLIIDDLHLQKVQVKVLKIAQKTKTLSISIMGNYTNIASLFGKKKVNELYLDGVRNIGDWGALPVVEHRLFTDKIFLMYYPSTTSNHIKDVVSGAIVTDYLFGKAIDYDTSQYPLVEDETISVINAWDRDKGTIMDATLFNALASYRNEGDYLRGLQTTERHFWVPFFRLGYFIKKCFTEFGWTVNGDIFTDPMFMQIVHYNTFSINRCAVNVSYFGSRTDVIVVCRAIKIFPQDHAPRMQIIEFLNEVGKNYNLQYNYNFSSKTVSINKIKNINTYAKNIDLTDVADPEPEISFTDDSDVKEGFNFEFESDSNDSASGVDIEFNSSFVYRGHRNIPADLITIGTPAIDNVAFVVSENKYYRYDGEDWIFYAHNLFNYKTSTSENLVSVKSKCITMPMTDEPTQYLWPEFSFLATYPHGRITLEKGEVVPYSNIGIEGREMYTYELDKYNRDLSGVIGPLEYELYRDCFYIQNYIHGKEYYPHLINYLGFRGSREDGSGAFPHDGFAKVSAVPYTCTGEFTGHYAQPWLLPLIGTPGTVWGLIPSWWEPFVTMLVNSNVTISQRVLLDILKYADIDWEKDYIWINNLRYLCTKAQINFPFPEIATLKLIKV